MEIHVEVEDPDDPRSLEVDLDFPREWLEFADPHEGVALGVTDRSLN